MSESMALCGTADICDRYKEAVQVAAPGFSRFGGAKGCGGEIVTIQLDEDNSRLRELLGSPGKGKIAVVDVGAKYFAVVGDVLAGIAVQNEWEGIVINGFVRDTGNLAQMPIGVWALGSCPRRSFKNADARLNIVLQFAAVDFRPGNYLYADLDGIVVSECWIDGVSLES